MKHAFGAGLLAAFGITAAVVLTPTASVRAQQKDHKVYICHGTASEKNPYVLIHVDESAVQGHLDGTAPGHGKNNHPDFIAHNGSCKVTPPPPSQGGS